MRGLFVTGTDTGVGKSVVAAAICAALAARGERVAAFKPVVTGLDEPDRATGRPTTSCSPPLPAPASRPSDVAPYRFGPPVSPHLAAELAGRDDRARAARGSRAHGGGRRRRCSSPRASAGCSCRSRRATSCATSPATSGLPLVVAARPGLGTINHTLLTIEAARAVGLSVAGVVMTPWPAKPAPIELSNRSTVERLARGTRERAWAGRGGLAGRGRGRPAA